MNSDKLIEFVTKLIGMTASEELNWKTVEIKTGSLIDDERVVDQAYQIELAGKYFQLFKYQYRYLVDEERVEWITSMRLRMVDIRGNNEYDFEYNNSLNDLYSIVREKSSDVAGIIDSFLSTQRQKFETVSELFHGEWLNTYVLPDGRSGTEVFKIESDNRWIVNGVHHFNIELFEVVGKDVYFNKIAVQKGDKRVLKNQLKLVDENTLEGTENANIMVTYTRRSE